MTYKELYEKAAAMLDRGEITLGDFNKMVKPLDVEIHPEPHWIPVTERLPKEEDSIFARYYGTDRWRKSMFRKKSREVIVTSVFEDGELHTEVAHTTDGEWHVGVNVVPRTVIAWMPLPEPFKEVTE